MLHCSLSVLADVLVLFNLISWSGHRDPHSQKREDWSTLHLANRTTNCVKSTRLCTEQTLQLMGWRQLTVKYLVLRFPLGASAVQCKHHPCCNKWAAVRRAPSSSLGSQVCSLCAICAHQGGLGHHQASDGQAQTPSKYFLLERDNLLQSSEATAGLWQEGVWIIYHMLESNQALQETLVMNYHALSRDSSADNMKNVLNEYQRLKQSASASSKTQRPFLTCTEIKPEHQNRKPKIK